MPGRAPVRADIPYSGALERRSGGTAGGSGELPSRGHTDCSRRDFSFILMFGRIFMNPPFLCRSDARRIARVLSQVENRSPGCASLMKECWKQAGGAWIIGITGPPGAGKSTLTSSLIRKFREEGKTVGVLAVDPSSSFSGGALLGDRIRMMEMSLDEGVFIRSAATRGSMGGLSAAAGDMITVMDAAGFDVILVETVGVGQDEIDIIREADSVILVLVPGLGDDIQALKAGIMEIADIFVVNKADKEGAEKLEREIVYILGLSPVRKEWTPPVVKTVASKNDGMGALAEKLAEHHRFLRYTAFLREKRKQRGAEKLRKLLLEGIEKKLKKGPLAVGEEEKLKEDFVGKRSDPYSAAEEILDDLSWEGTE